MSDRHRNTRLVIAGLLAAGVLAAAGCAAQDAGGTAGSGSPEPEQSDADEVPVIGSTPIDCGQRFSPPAGTGITLTGQFPATVSVDPSAGTDPGATGAMVSGTIKVTSPVAVRGVVGPVADVFLVRDGTVVTVPAPQDSVGVAWELEAGVPADLPGRTALVACGPGAGPMPAGTYDLYARVVLTPDGGAPVEAFGGPWPIELQ